MKSDLTSSNLEAMNPSSHVVEHICLVHYHEVGLKGRNRSTFERRLKENIEKRLLGFFECRVLRISGRLLVATDDWCNSLSIADIVADVPGVVRVSCGLRTAQDLEIIKEAARMVLEKAEPFLSFKVNARRANTDFPIDSMELNRIIGASLSGEFRDKRVQMRDPDACVHVEMVQGIALVYAHTFKGVGGLPVGTAGRVVSLLSAGLDSPVATFRIMKRGASVFALHFSGHPEISDTSKHLVKEIVEILRPYGGIEQLSTVAFGSYQRELVQIVPPELRVIFYRRLMFAVANALATSVNAKALVTGESLGQVASQTLDNIRVIDTASELPVLRPLIGTDKQEIITEAQKLGTYEISSQSHDDCCTLFIPRNPETHAKLTRVDRIWNDLPVAAWTEDILSNIESVNYR